MKATQFAEDVAAAYAAEFPNTNPEGPQPIQQWPSKYFNHNVTVPGLAPGAPTVPRSAKWCATVLGAWHLSGVITEELAMPCTVELRAAIQHVLDSEPVPFLQFKQPYDPAQGPYTGMVTNAGLLLDYFNHGNPAQRALNLVEADLYHQIQAYLGLEEDAARITAIMAKEA